MGKAMTKKARGITKSQQNDGDQLQNRTNTEEQPAETIETNQQGFSQPSVEDQPNVSLNGQQTSDTPPIPETEPKLVQV